MIKSYISNTNITQSAEACGFYNVQISVILNLKPQTYEDWDS